MRRVRERLAGSDVAGDREALRAAVLQAVQSWAPRPREPDESASVHPPRAAKRARDAASSSSSSVGAADSAVVDPRVAALRAMHRAARVGPGVLRGLGDLPVDEYIVELSSRLKGRGCRFDGVVPTRREIDTARREADRRLDLDGIDTSNILAPAAAGQAGGTAPTLTHSDVASAEQPDLFDDEPAM